MGSQRSADDRDAHAVIPLDDVRSVMDSLRRIVRTLRVASVASERSLGVTAAQLFVLQLLAEVQPCSIGDLADRTLTHQSSVSVVVSKLEAQGLVARKPSKRDARRVEISLTAKGRARLRRAPQAAQFRIVEGVRALPLAQRRALARALGSLVQHIGASDDEPAMLFEDEGSSGPAPRAPRARKAGVRRVRA